METKITPEYIAELDSIIGQLTDVTKRLEVLPVWNTTTNAWNRAMESLFWLRGRRGACDKKPLEETKA